MKKLSVLVSLGLIISMLTGCVGAAPGGANDEAEAPAQESTSSDETVEFMTGTAIDTALYKEYENMVAAFAEANPDAAEIELVPSSTDHEGEIKTRLGGGNIPDMWMTHGWSLGRYSEYLLDLQDQEWAGDVSPLLSDIMFGEGGELYALPINVDIAGIMYNEDVIKAAGYEVSDLTTWDKFNEACDAIKANGVAPIYNAGKDRWPTGLYIDWIAPTYFTDEDNQSMLDGTFVEDKYRSTLEMVDSFAQNDYFNADYSSATSDDVARALAQGDTAFSFLMNFVLVTAYEYNPEGNMGFMPIPNVEGEDPYYVCGEKDAIGIAKDGANVETCVAFLDFLAQPENMEALATSSGQMAGLTTATADLGAIAGSFTTINDYPGVPYFDRVYMPSGSWDPIVATTEMVVTKQKTLDEALTQIEKDYTSLVSQ